MREAPCGSWRAAAASGNRWRVASHLHPKSLQVDAAETLALNNLTADSTLPLNYRLKLPKWNESCPEDGVPAVLPSDTVQ